MGVLLGVELQVVVVVIIAQLMPQIVASLYPTQFLQLVVMKPAYYACIILETTGITHFCWVLAWSMSRVLRMTNEVDTREDQGRGDKTETKENQGYVIDSA